MIGRSIGFVAVQVIIVGPAEARHYAHPPVRLTAPQGFLSKAGQPNCNQETNNLKRDFSISRVV
jgi:hypothetical protein